MGIHRNRISYKQLIFISVCIGILLQIGYRIYRGTPAQSNILPTGITQIEEHPGVGVRIEFSPDNTETVTVSDATTAFSALEKAAMEKQVPLTVKQYDFGVFVERIGTYSASQQKAWIYYVNGQSGDVAADKKIIQPGDQVEWKYETPRP